MAVILLGYRGSGKSTVGRALSERLGVEVVDTDELIVGRAGMPIGEIFRRHGEGHFRDLEEAAVAEALVDPGVIVSLGGGVILREANRARLVRDGRLKVYLSCEAGELARRLSGDPNTALHRPALTGGGAAGGGGAGAIEEITRVLSGREALYRECADVTLDVTRAGVGALVEELAEQLRRRGKAV